MLTRLCLVFPLDLENIKEVCGGGMDLDEVLIVLLGDRVREVCHTELLGGLLMMSFRFLFMGAAMVSRDAYLDIFFELDAAHCDDIFSLPARFRIRLKVTKDVDKDEHNKAGSSFG